MPAAVAVAVMVVIVKAILIQLQILILLMVLISMLLKEVQLLSLLRDLDLVLSQPFMSALMVSLKIVLALGGQRPVVILLRLTILL